MRDKEPDKSKPDQSAQQPPLVPEIHRVQRPKPRDFSAEDWKNVTGVELQPVSASHAWWNKYKNSEEIPLGMRPIPPAKPNSPTTWAMAKETKFGYGLLFVGVGMPYLIEKLFGPGAAIFVSVGFVMIGIVFLVAGHLHRERVESQGLRTILFAGVLISIIVATTWMVIHQPSFTPQGASGGNTEKPNK